MPVLSNLNVNHFRMLICLPLLIGVWSAIFPPQALHISQAWPNGPATLVMSRAESDRYSLSEVSEHHKLAANRVIINEASHEELMACPGIGSKTATLIIKERAYGKFYDWRDLSSRVKGLSNSKISRLQDAGVKLHGVSGN
ncbi:MAG: helix-hairpin-helix domain-containing protein [Candidatus Riflebacteria bacterium]|nr:helix-hairpin-helix domain-containing protein [Candidatus Riflebacteria bacterium]